MSEFAGLWRLDGRPVEGHDIDRLAAGLNGRGIQPARVWRSGPVALVHRQHLFTPEDRLERMPLAGASGRVLLADCRLAERDDLCRALNEERRDKPDGELILSAFERWGTDAPARLYGEFATALWHPAERRLILARDHAGYRTLYLHRGERVIAFSTRLRALLALPEVPRELDDQALADYLILNPGPPTRTLYGAITRIPTGHLAVIDEGGVRLEKHWTPPVPGTLHPRDDHAVEEEARDLLDKAVTGALRASGPVTLLLTAGLDSPAIAESAARQMNPRQLLAVTRVPGGPIPAEGGIHYFDEAPRVRAVAERLPNLDWHRVGDDGGDSGEHDVRRFFLESGLPSRAPQNIAWFFPIYRFMAERGSRITIGGEQGNTYFSASGLEFLPSLLQGLHWQTLAGEIRALARVEGTSIWSVVKSRVLRPYEPLSWRLRRQSEAPEPWGRHSALNPSFAAELDLERTLDISRYRLRIGGGHPSAQTFRAWLWHDENARDTRSGLRAMTGTEHRLPLADRRLVEFIGALPRDQFLRKGVTRFLARRLLAGRLPDAIVNGRARGVQNGDWFAIVSAQRPAMQAELSRLRGQKLASRVVDLDRLQNLLDGWPRDASEAEPQRAKYLQMLTRGMEMARFLAWHEGGNG